MYLLSHRLQNRLDGFGVENGHLDCVVGRFTIWFLIALHKRSIFVVREVINMTWSIPNIKTRFQYFILIVDIIFCPRRPSKQMIGGAVPFFVE